MPLCVSVSPQTKYSQWRPTCPGQRDDDPLAATTGSCPSLPAPGYLQTEHMFTDRHTRTHAWRAMFQDNNNKAVHTMMGHVSRQEEKGSSHKDEPNFKTSRRQSTQRWAMFQDNKKKAVHTKMGCFKTTRRKQSTQNGSCFKTTRKRQSTQRWAMFQDKKKAVHTKMGHVSRQEEKGSPHKDVPGFKTTRKRQYTQRWSRFQDNKGKSTHRWTTFQGCTVHMNR